MTQFERSHHFNLVVLAFVFALMALNAMPSVAQTSPSNETSAPLRFQSIAIKSTGFGNDLHQVRILLTPDGFNARNATLASLIETAYGVDRHEVSGIPAWANSQTFDVDGLVTTSVAEELRALDESHRKAAERHMVQELLASRFKLSIHTSSEPRPIYLLSIAGTEPKLQRSIAGDTYATGLKTASGLTVGPNRMLMTLQNGQVTEISGQGVPLAEMVRQLSQQLDATVVDRTGLIGNYDFTVRWTPNGQGPSQSVASLLPSALEQQLGLTLEQKTAPLDILIVDHVEQPTDN